MATYNGTSDPDYLYGGEARDTLRGRGGNDSLYGYGGADTVSGDAGDDYLSGGEGNDALSGGDGNDTLRGEYGDDTLRGGAGDDSLEAGYDGANLVEGGAGDDTLIGVYAGDDTLAGGAGSDRLDGRGGADALRGEGGNDFLLLTDGATLLDGGSGQDTLSFESYYGSYGVTYQIGASSFTTTSGTTRLAGFEHVTGSAYDDTLTGNRRANVIDGGGGDDTLAGGNGDDTLMGGAGSDSMTGGRGDDFVSYAYWSSGTTTGVSIDLGETGAQAITSYESDTLSGFEGVEGSAANDTLRGGDGDESLRGGLGDDRLTGGDGRDTADYSDATADLVVDLSRTGAQETGWGRDRLRQIENVLGGAGDDRLKGSDGANRLSGGAGDDTLLGGAGDDTLSGGAGFDLADYSAHRGAVRVAIGGATSGPAGDDTLLSIEAVKSGRGDDRLVGDGRDNLLIGGAGEDTLLGGKGSDTLMGGKGSDRLDGGAGSDWADYSDLSVKLAIDLAKSRQVNPGAGTDSFSSIENVAGGTRADALRGDGRANVLSGGGGGDTLLGGDGDDTLIGGTGDDLLNAGGGKNQRLVGGAGDDTYVLGSGKGSGVIEDAVGAADKLDASGAKAAARIDLGIGEASTSDDYTLRIAKTGSSSLPIDLVFAQDLSGSFGDDIANVRALVPEIAESIQDVNRASAFGAVGFIDKAMGSFGGTGDYVYRVFQSVTPSEAALSEAYGAMTIGNGADGPESQLEALLKIARNADGEVGFRSDTLRLVVLFTDATYHVAGDADDLPNNDGDGRADGDPAGTGEDYPSIAQVRSELAAAGILPVFAVTEGVEADYRDLVARFGFGGVVSIDDDSSDVVRAIRDVGTVATSTAIEIAEGTRFDDVIRGNTVDNTLIGGRGDDRLSGLFGADELLGGRGKDTLAGGSGNDTLTGGAGADQLTGEGGRDRFVFAEASDSARGARDLITDFRHGSDRIDLRGIDANETARGEQSLRFIGAADSGDTGELYFVRDGGLRLLRADLDGHGGYDFEIAVKGGALTEGDFLL